MRVAKAFNTDITFPVVITSEPPCPQPSIDPVLSQQIYRALANYLVSRASAELASNEAGEEETEPEQVGTASTYAGRLTFCCLFEVCKFMLLRSLYTCSG